MKRLPHRDGFFCDDHPYIDLTTGDWAEQEPCSICIALELTLPEEDDLDELS